MKSGDTIKILGLIALILVISGGMFWGFSKMAVTGETIIIPGPGEENLQPGQSVVDFGKSATLYLNSFDAEHTSELEVYPEYYVVDSKGNKIVNGATANSTASTVGEFVDIYGSDEDASYYVDPVMNVELLTEAPTVTLVAHDILTRSSASIVIYDDTMTALTAETQGNKSSIDYAGDDFGVSECNPYNVKFKNGEATSLYRLGAICVGWGGDVDYVKLSESGWEESAVFPDELDDASLTTKNDANTSYSSNWKECYVPVDADYIEFKEWDSELFEIDICADSTGADENTGDVFHILFADWGYEKGKDGEIYGDFYVHDDNEEISDVGVSEATDVATPKTLYLSATVELH